MSDLMLHVERIVRPIRAAARRKLRIRRELLAHLQSAFNEERARGLDEPAALIRKLQSTVPRFERLAVTPFPGSAAKMLLIASVLLPLILAVAVFLDISACPAACAIFIAGIVVMELRALFW